MLHSLSEVINACPKCLTFNPFIIDVGRNVTELLASLKVTCKWDDEHLIEYKDINDHETTCESRCQCAISEEYECEWCGDIAIECSFFESHPCYRGILANRKN